MIMPTKCRMSDLANGAVFSFGENFKKAFVKMSNNWAMEEETQISGPNIPAHLDYDKTGELNVYYLGRTRRDLL